MNLEQFFGKRSRKEEKRIQEVRRQRQIKIGPQPKMLKRTQNIALMMDDIYLERFMKGRDDANFTNKIRDFRNVKIIDYNRHQANFTKDFDEEEKNKKEEPLFKQSVDLREMNLIKSPLIDETYENNINFLQKTKQIRQTILHTKSVVKPPQKKVFENNDAEVNEILRTTIDLDKKKTRMQTIKERIEMMNEKQQAMSANKSQSSVQSPKHAQSLRGRAFSQENQFKFPVSDLFTAETPSESNQRTPSIRIFMPSEKNIKGSKKMQKVTIKESEPSLQYIEDIVFSKNLSQVSLKPTLLDIRRMELERMEMEEKKLKLEERQRKIDDIRSKLGLVRLFEIKKDVDLAIEIIQKDIDKIDQDLNNATKIKSFKIVQPRPLTFSLNENYKNHQKSHSLDNKNSYPLVQQKEDNFLYNSNVPMKSLVFLNDSNTMTTTNFLSPRQQQNNSSKPQNNNNNNSNNSMKYLNPQENILQNNKVKHFQEFALKQGIPSKRLSIPTLQLSDTISVQTTTVQSPKPFEQTKFNFNTERIKIKSSGSNSSRQSMHKAPETTARTNNASNAVSSQLTNILQSPPIHKNSILSSRSNSQLAFTFTPKLSSRPSTQQNRSQQFNFAKSPSSAVATPSSHYQENMEYSKEMRRQVNLLFQQVDILQKQTREQAKEETVYAKEQTKQIVEDFKNWEIEFQEFNTDADKRLLHDIKQQMKMREIKLQENLQEETYKK